MGQISRIGRNSLFAFLSQLIRLVTNVLLFVGIARFYGIEEFGQFATAHVLSTIFLLFADFGFDVLLPTEISRDRSQAARIVQQYLSLKIVIVCATTLIMVSIPAFTDMSPSTQLLVQILAFHVLLASLNNFFYGVFKGFEEFHHEARISLWTNLLLLVQLIALGVAHAPLHLIALSLVGTRFLGLLASFRVAVRLIGRAGVRIDFTGWTSHWNKTVVFGLNFIFGNLFFQLDTIIIAVLLGDLQVGVYQSAFKIAVLGLLVADIAVFSTLPLLSRLHHEDQDRWNRAGKLLNKVLLLTAIPITVLLFVFAEQVIALVYGVREFSNAAPILRIFALTVLVRFIVETAGIMITTSQRQSTRLRIVAMGTIVNGVLNLIFIPRYGIMAAALIALVTNIMIGVAYVVLARIQVGDWFLDRALIFPSLAGVTLAICSWQVRSYSMLIVMLPVIASYALIVYFVGFGPVERKAILGRRSLRFDDI